MRSCDRIALSGIYLVAATVAISYGLAAGFLALLPRSRAAMQETFSLRPLRMIAPVITGAAALALCGPLAHVQTTAKFRRIAPRPGNPRPMQRGGSRPESVLTRSRKEIPSELSFLSTISIVAAIGSSVRHASVTSRGHSGTSLAGIRVKGLNDLSGDEIDRLQVCSWIWHA